MKLEGALDRCGIDPEGLVCADIGASTGGFTDCLLRRGAAKVWAVDAVHDQLDPTLREDPRVVNCEGVNARALSPAVIPEPVSLAVLDLSFISQTQVLASLDAVGLGAVGLKKSPVRGGDGNTEFLVYAKRGVPRTVGERETAEAVQA